MRIEDSHPHIGVDPTEARLAVRAQRAYNRLHPRGTARKAYVARDEDTGGVSHVRLLDAEMKTLATYTYDARKDRLKLLSHCRQERREGGAA